MTARTKTVLLTAFEPFGGDVVNASELAARPLDGVEIAGHRVSVAILPCVFGAAIERLRREIDRLEPALVVACGEAGGRSEISVERIAINVDDARIADNAGQQPIDVAVDADGPAAYFSRLPIKSIVRALSEAKIPAAISQSAGTFVCNHVFYGLMRALEDTDVRGGFVHVPREGTERTTRALAIVIATALAEDRDAKLAYGATE